MIKVKAVPSSQINDKPDGCRHCPLYKIGKGFVKGCGDPQSKLWLVGEAPAIDELLQGKPFVGKAGQLLREWVFKNAGVNPDEVYIDNIIRCVQPGNELPPAKILQQAVECCKQYEAELPADWIGDMFTFHPAALLRDCVPLPLVIHDVGRARDISRGGTVRVLLGLAVVRVFYGFVKSIRAWRGNFEEKT